MEGQGPSGTRLDGHHRITLERLFAHPMSHNLQWHDVLSLLGAVGSVEERRPGHHLVRVGDQSATLDQGHHTDLQPEQVAELRRLLRAGGVAPSAPESD
jgi:hypothetical protein